MPMRLLAAVLTLAVLAGCGARANATGRLNVVTAFYPLQFLSEQIGGLLVVGQGGRLVGVLLDGQTV